MARGGNGLCRVGTYAVPTGLGAGVMFDSVSMTFLRNWVRDTSARPAEPPKTHSTDRLTCLASCLPIIGTCVCTCLRLPLPQP